MNENTKNEKKIIVDTGDKTMEIEASLGNLDEVQSFVKEQMAKYNPSAKMLNQIDLSVEEIFVNIASYAYSPSNGNVVVECAIEEIESDDSTDGNRVRITFKDSGVPFDPLAKEDADVTLSADERQIGGLGIYMVKNLMDQIDYQYVDGQNVFTMWAEIK